MSRRKSDLPEGFVAREVDISGELKKRSGSLTLLVPHMKARMYRLQPGDEVIAKILAVRRKEETEE